MKKLAPILRLLVFAAIAAGLTWFVFKDLSLQQILDTLKTLHWGWIVASIVIGFVAYPVRAMRWKLLIEATGHNTSLLNATKAVGVAYLANLALPRLGEVTRCTILAQREKIPLNILIGTVIAERAIDVITLLILIITVALLRIETIGAYFWKNTFAPLFAKLGSAANNTYLMMVVVLVLLIGAALVWYVITKTKFGEALKKLWLGFQEGLLSVRKVKNKPAFIAQSIGLWLIYYSVMYVCFFAVPDDLNVGPIDMLFLFVMGAIGMAAPTPGGTGTYHIAVVEGFKIVGIGAVLAGVLATIFHLSQIIMMIVMGVASLLMLSKKTSTNEQATSHSK